MNNLLLFHTNVPQGAYFADLSDEQIRAIGLGRRIGKGLAKENPEIAELYRNLDNFQTLNQIAESYVSSRHSLEVARHAIAYALRILIPEGELRELQAARDRRALEIQVGGFDSEQARERAYAAWKKRQEIYGAPLEALIRGRGQTPWTKDERNLLYALLHDTTYRKPTGGPDYELIALELNIQLHDSEEVRTEKTVGNYYRDLRRKARNNPSDSRWQRFLE